MRQLLVLAFAIMLGPICSAEVIRCTDAAGNVSYTDGGCPSGARQVGRVSVPEPAPVRDEVDAVRASPPQRAPTDAAAQPLQAPSGPTIIDSRGVGSSNSSQADDAAVADYGYGYAYPGGYRQPRPPRDMRPRLRNCDAAGCQDTQGNHYNRSGQLDSYRSLNGQTCRPVGTTTVCR